MKVACISHGSIVPFNRRPYDLLATAHGIAITVILPERWTGDLPAPAIRFVPAAGGAPCRALPVRRSGNGSLFTLGGLRGALEALAPDVVLLDEEPWSLVAAQVLRAVGQAPLVFYTKQNIVKRLPPPFSWIRRSCYRRAAAAWAVGETTAEVLRATRFDRPTHLVPHGVEVGAFQPGRDEARRAALGLRGVVIGYAGRLVEEKGIGDLLAAARSLAADPTLDVTLAIAGAGPMAAEVERAAADLGGRVRLLPAVPHQDAPALYRLFDVVIVPSRAAPRWREQFGRVLVEAAATGLPIIAAGTGEIPHVMRGLGGGGRVVADRDPAALAAAMRDLAADAALRRRIGAANLDAARRVYSQEAVAARMASLLEGAA